MNFKQFFINASPTNHGLYDELELVPEGPLAGGSSTTARDGNDQATLDFSGLNVGEPLSFAFGMDNVYAPFDGSSFYSYDLLFSGPSWDNFFECGYSDLGSITSNPDTADVAFGHVESQPVQSTERLFALDISNTKDRATERIPQPLSGSASSVSPTEVETPTNSSYTEDSVDTFTASSSPAGKSARQRGSAASSSANKGKKIASIPAKQTEESNEGTPTTGTLFCGYEGCGKGPFYDEETRKRHIREIHIGIRHRCPGCGATLSRKSSVTRHLNLGLWAPGAAPRR